MLHHKQKGLSPIGILFMVCTFALIVVTGLKLTPHYLDYNTIRSVYETVASDPNIAKKGPAEVYDALSKALTLNSIQEFNLQSNTYFNNDSGEKVLGFNYEIRVHMFSNIDVVLTFDHEIYVGE